MRASIAAGAFAVILALAGAPASAQTSPIGSEQAPLFGFNEDWDAHFDKLGLAAGAGADVTRAVISWRAVEPRPGELSWQRYDEIYERMLETGTRPVWVLADAPCWAWSAGSDQCGQQADVGRPPDRAHDGHWALFAALVALRYPQTAAVESWNEPNLDNFWRPRPRPKRAAEITAWANLGVKLVEPEIPVLLGGLSPLTETTPRKGEIAYDEFIRAAYDAVGPGHWDAVAIHPFPRFKARKRYLKDIVEHLDRVRGALADSKAAGTPIWVTEIGLSTAGPFPYTTRQQALGLVRIYRRLAAMTDVPAVIVHRLVDLPPTVETAEAGWGIIRPDGRQKAAYCALSRERGEAC
jgi:hypothetical protein